MEKMKNRKGFTLVELIVVIVILGILMAIAIPNVIAYIDKANAKADGLAVRNVYLAACSVMAEAYADKSAAHFTNNAFTGLTDDDYEEIAKLAGVDASSFSTGSSTTAAYTVNVTGNEVTSVELAASASQTGSKVTYTPDGTIAFDPEL